MELPAEEVRALDELAPSAVQDWLLPWREEYYAPHEAYLDHLAKLIQAIGQAGESVIVGRGAGFLLPRESTLSIRVIAPMKARARRMAERLGVSARTARRAARDLDRRHDRFARTMYRVDPADPHRYDLVLDTDSLGLTIAVELIVRAVEAGQPPLILPAEAGTAPTSLSTRAHRSAGPTQTAAPVGRGRREDLSQRRFPAVQSVGRGRRAHGPRRR